jgi:alpha-D-xyloside xylohydrolase
MTYAYEKGENSITHLHWDDASQSLEHTGARAWTQPDPAMLEVVEP